MPAYHRLGEVPPKRHTQFRKADGSLYSEEVFGTEGFSGNYSILYYHYPPTRITKFAPLSLPSATQARPNAPEIWHEGVQRHHHLKSAALGGKGDAVLGRQIVMYNQDIVIGVAKPTETMDYYYRSGDADLVYFVQAGEGVCESVFGALPFHSGDYIVIPRGTTFRFDLPSLGRTAVTFLTIEAHGTIEPPHRYYNHQGQLLEHAPYCERDIRRPEELITHTEVGEFEVRVKVGDTITCYTYDHHPLNVVGWDGCAYPWIFNIHDFEPITGRVHQPPPVHQTFQGPNFVVCSFVPRKLDYHPLSVPVPYNHSNIDSDELLYYVNGNFGSRRGIEQESLTLHPRGIPHGPQPGVVEQSLGAERTEEMAVMIDTFNPLLLTSVAQAIDDPSYPYSWSGPV